LDELLTNMPLSEISRWISLDIADDDVRNYLFNKSLYPSSLPVEEKDLAIEQAVARQVIRGALKKASERFPDKEFNYPKHLLPWFEPIIAAGSVLTQSPSVDQTALMLIDSLQPTGVTTLLLDHNYLTSALGAAASINQLMVVHVLETEAFMHLGTVITPVGEAPIGTPVLRLQMIRDDGQDVDLEIQYGDLELIPLPVGQKARLQLYPLHLFDVGMGAPGRGGAMRVMGGELGVIIDARGRPLELPDDRNERSELLAKWCRALTG
ncbi:glutamate mutase L, partial [Chloroflexota bacterium]